MAWRKPANLHEWLGVLSRHRKKLFFPMITVMVAVVIGSFGVPREYRAEAKFQRVSDLSIDQTGSNIINRNLEVVRRSMVEDLAGKPALETLIEDLGLSRGLPHTADGALTLQGQQLKNDLVGKFQSRLGVRWQTESDQIDQITVSFADPDRDMAPRAANQLVENYLRETRRKLDETLLMAKTFFEKEVDRYRALVQDLETKQVQFKMNNAGMLPDDPSSVQNKLVELRASLQRVRQDLEVNKSQRSRLEEWTKAQPDEIVQKHQTENPALTQMIAERGELEKTLHEHLYFYGRTEDHPLVKKTRQQITELDKRIEQTQALVEGPSMTQPNPAKIDAQRTLETMAGTISALVRQRDEVQDQIEKFEMLDRTFVVVRAEYVQLQRDLTEATDQLRFWESNLNRTTVALKAELGARGVQLRFTQRADAARPSKPTVMMVIAAAMALGLACGAFIVLLAELTDHSFRTVDQAIDELKLPVLGAVTEIKTPAELMRRKIFDWAVYPAIGGAMLLVLLVSVWLVYLNLEDNQRFEQLMRHPAQVVLERLGGHGT